MSDTRRPSVVVTSTTVSNEPDGVCTRLHLQVPKVPRPRTRLEAAPRYRLRLVVDDVPLLFARIESYWDEAHLLRSDRPSPRVLDAIDADTLRAHAHLDDDGWCRFFVERVLTSTASPLYEGDWFVSTLRPVPRAAAWTHPFASMDGHRMFPPATTTTTTTTTTASMLPMMTVWSESWSFGADDERVPQGELFLRRALSDDDDGRRRFWRKQARAGALPPVLVWFVPLLQKFVVLDGHVRLQAALDEGIVPTLVCLWAAHVEAPAPPAQSERLLAVAADLEARGVGSVDDFNRIALRAYGVANGPVPTARGWPISTSTWTADVVATAKRLKATRTSATVIDDLISALLDER